MAAVDIFVERLIREMQVLTFSVTSDEVSCKFIPPLSTETTNSLKLWIESMKKLGEMKLYIQR